jgi:hypothetical protein
MENLVQWTSVVGAALILVAYGLLQQGLLRREDPRFNGLNLLGAALLTVVALADMRWGFIFLEATWALLSLRGLLRPRPTN